MCDAQEIDRLCKTQPTGENNNNNNNNDRNNRRHVKTEESAELRHETAGGGAAPGDATIPGRLAEHVSPRQ